MFKTILIIIISGLLAVSKAAQTFVDIDNDGYVDTISVIKITSNFMSEQSLSVKSGKNGITYNSVRIGNVGNFFSIIPVNIPVIDDSFYVAYRTILKDSLCSGFIEKKTPDESLRWLLEYYEKPEYKHINQMKLQWFDYVPDFKPYYVIIKRDDYPNLVANIPTNLKNSLHDSAHINSLFCTVKEFIIVYYAQNQVYNDNGTKFPQLIISNKNVDILKTKHGVLLRKNNKYCWLYISDGLYKLRNASIGSVKYKNKNILIDKVAVDDKWLISINVNNETYYTISELEK